MNAWMDKQVGRQRDHCSGEWVGHFLHSVGTVEPVGRLLGQPASCSSRAWGRIERFLPRRVGYSHAGVARWTLSSCPLSLADPVPAIPLAAWAPVIPAVAAVPAKRMWKATCVTGG